MKKLLPAFCCCILMLACSPSLRAQKGTFEAGLSYRYIRLSEGGISLSHSKWEEIGPHELDFNVRFDIGSDKIKGTFTLGFTRYDNADFAYPNLLWSNCTVGDYTATAENYSAYRFNPGAEYITYHGKISYGAGAGVFYYGGIAGKQQQVFIREYNRFDSISGTCVTDSSTVRVANGRAPYKTIIALGASAHFFLGCQLTPALTVFASFSLNPTYTLRDHYASWGPSGSIGIHYLFYTKRTQYPD